MSKSRKSSRRRPTARYVQAPVNPAAYRLLLAVCIIGGAAARVMAGRGELWLDEIWSYRLAHLLTTPLGVFTELHSDNNHYLNTLYLRTIPEGTGTWLLYRLHSLAAGIATIAFAARIARPAGDRGALAAAGLAAPSFLMIVYSSEARGYSLAIFAAFLCVLLAQRYLATERLLWAGAFGSAAVIGLLSHLTFVHALAGLIAWSAVRASRSQTKVQILRSMLALHAVPLVVLGAIVVVDIRHVVLGGGPLTTPWDVAAGALASSLGAPDSGGLKTTAIFAALVVSAVSLSAVRRSGSDLWVLFLVTGFIAPALSFALVDSGVVFERYLLVAIAFIMVSWAWTVAAVWRVSRLAALLLVVSLIAGNMVRSAVFLARGRGSFVPALTHVVQQAVQKPIGIGSDHDFRIGRMIEFYQRFVPGGTEIRYYDQAAWPEGGPEWLMTHRLEPGFAPSNEITAQRRYWYRLVDAYPYGGLSGWHLALYHVVPQGR